MSFFDFLLDLANPHLAFLSRAVVMAVLSAVLCSIIGTHVVLRGSSFIGEALAHAVFPGIALAYALGFSILLGGAVAGAIVTILITVFSRDRRVGQDAIIAIFFASAFATGLVIMSQIDGYTGSLESFLFGSLTASTASDLVTTTVAGIVLLGVLALAHRPLVSVSLDREFAAMTGINTTRMDLVLHLSIAGAVVLSVQTIGNILVLALLVTPPSIARLLSDRIGTMMIISPIIASFAAFIGIWVSWAADVPTGAAIVLCLFALFLLAWLISRGGSLATRRRRGKLGSVVQYQETHQRSVVHPR